MSGEEAEGSKVASELEREEEYSGWKSEEEELGDEDDNTEDKDEDYKGTTCICVVSDVHKAPLSFKVKVGCCLCPGDSPASCCTCRAQRKHPKTSKPHFLTRLFITSNTATAVYLESVTHNCYKYSSVCQFGVRLKIVPFLSDCNLNGYYKECMHVENMSD